MTRAAAGIAENLRRLCLMLRRHLQRSDIGGDEAHHLARDVFTVYSRTAAARHPKTLLFDRRAVAKSERPLGRRQSDIEGRGIGYLFMNASGSCLEAETPKLTIDQAGATGNAVMIAVVGIGQRQNRIWRDTFEKNAPRQRGGGAKLDMGALSEQRPIEIDLRCHMHEACRIGWIEMREDPRFRGKSRHRTLLQLAAIVGIGPAMLIAEPHHEAASAQNAIDVGEACRSPALVTTVAGRGVEQRPQPN